MSNDDLISLEELISTSTLGAIRRTTSFSIPNQYRDLFSDEGLQIFDHYSLHELDPLEIIEKGPSTQSGKVLVRPTKLQIYKDIDPLTGYVKSAGFFYSPCVELTLKEYNDMKLARCKEICDIAKTIYIPGTFGTPHPHFLLNIISMAKEDPEYLVDILFGDKLPSGSSYNIGHIDTPKERMNIVLGLRKFADANIASTEEATEIWTRLDADTQQILQRLLDHNIQGIANYVNTEMSVEKLVAVKNKPGYNCDSLRGCCCCMDKENVYSPGTAVPVERKIIKDMISNIDEAECFGYQKGNLTKIGNTYKNLGKYDKTTWSWAPEIDIDGNPIPSRCVPTDKKSVMTVVTERTSEGDVLSQESVKLCDGDCEKLYWIVYCKEQKAYINKQNTLNRGQRIEGVLNLDLPEILSTLDEEESNLQYYTTFDEAESDFRTRKCFGIDGKAKPECSKPCDCTQQTPLGANSQVFTMVCEGDPIIKSFDFSEDEQKKQYCELVDKDQVMFISQSSDILSAYSGFVGNDSCSASNWYGISCSNGDPELITGKTYEELVKGGNAFVALYKHSSNNTEDHTEILQAVNCVNPNEQTLL